MMALARIVCFHYEFTAIGETDTAGLRLTNR
jgi:hypothetical protein